MLILILILNFAVSWWNCYAAGGMWAESKALGGFPRVLAWSAVIQAGIGFSSVFGFAFGYVVYLAGYMPPKVATGAVSLWYLLVIVPAVGTGLAITVHSWIIAFRERSLLNMGTAAYNTVVQLHNMYGMIDGIGKAFSGIGELVEDADRDSMPLILAVLLVGFALGSGAYLTYALVNRYAGRIPLPARGTARA